MRPTAVLASALVRSATVLTEVCSSREGGGGGGGSGAGGGGGAASGAGGAGAGQVDTVPETSVGVVGQEQTVPPLTWTLRPPDPEAVLPVIEEDVIVTVPKEI